MKTLKAIAFCRVTADLRNEQIREWIADQRQTFIDEAAEQYFNDMRNGTLKLSEWVDSLSDKEIREVFSEYLARKYEKRDVSIADDRQITANEYLEAILQKWCKEQATLDMKE